MSTLQGFTPLEYLTVMVSRLSLILFIYLFIFFIRIIYLYPGGSYASQLCSEKYCAQLITILNTKLLSLPPEQPIDETYLDAFICDTVYNLTKELNNEIKSHSKTGTTALVLLIYKSKDGSMKIYCINSGNSRCILAFKDIVLAISNDHSLKNPSEYNRVKNHEQADMYSTPLDITLLPVKKLLKDDIAYYLRSITYYLVKYTLLLRKSP